MEIDRIIAHLEETGQPDMAEAVRSVVFENATLKEANHILGERLIAGRELVARPGIKPSAVRKG